MKTRGGGGAKSRKETRKKENKIRDEKIEEGLERDEYELM